MIKSFKNNLAENIFHGIPLDRKQAKAFPASLVEKAAIKLDALNRVTEKEELFFPPSNRFHALGGNRNGQYAIDIKKGSPYHIIFRWADGPCDVEIDNYH